MGGSSWTQGSGHGLRHPPSSRGGSLLRWVVGVIVLVAAAIALQRTADAPMFPRRVYSAVQVDVVPRLRRGLEEDAAASASTSQLRASATSMPPVVVPAPLATERAEGCQRWIPVECLDRFRQCPTATAACCDNATVFSDPTAAESVRLWCAAPEIHLTCAMLARHADRFVGIPRVDRGADSPPALSYCTRWRSVRWTSPITPARLLAAQATHVPLRRCSLSRLFGPAPSHRLQFDSRSHASADVAPVLPRMRLLRSDCDLDDVLQSPDAVLAALHVASHGGRQPILIDGDSMMRHMFNRLVAALRGPRRVGSAREVADAMGEAPSIDHKVWRDLAYVVRRLDDEYVVGPEAPPRSSSDFPPDLAMTASISPEEHAQAIAAAFAANRTAATSGASWGPNCDPDDAVNPCLLQVVFLWHTFDMTYDVGTMVARSMSGIKRPSACADGGVVVRVTGGRPAFIPIVAVPAWHLRSVMYWLVLLGNHEMAAVNGSAATLFSWYPLSLRRWNAALLDATPAEGQCRAPDTVISHRSLYYQHLYVTVPPRKGQTAHGGKPRPSASNAAKNALIAKRNAAYTSALKTIGDGKATATMTTGNRSASTSDRSPRLTGIIGYYHSLDWGGTVAQLSPTFDRRRDAYHWACGWSIGRVLPPALAGGQGSACTANQSWWDLAAYNLEDCYDDVNGIAIQWLATLARLRSSSHNATTNESTLRRNSTSG